VALSLGQIGEFSFILASLAQGLGLLPAAAMHVLVAASIFSISVSPLLQYIVEPIHALCAKSRLLNPLVTMRRPWTLKPAAMDGFSPNEIVEGFRTVIVGYGPVGKTVARLLYQRGVTPTVIEMNHTNISTIRADGFRAVLGDANHLDTLRHAGVAASQSLILSASTIRGAIEIIRLARELNPKIKIIIRSAYLRERLPLIQSGADTVFAGEGEVALAMAEYILRNLGATADQIDRERDRVRSELFS
jgi:CPA2 family monovalent cation:H+ antiporter-2